MSKEDDIVLRLAITSMQGLALKQLDIEARLLTAMRYVRANAPDLIWMVVPTDDLLFRVALGAVLLATDDTEERLRLTNSIQMLRNVNAMLSGVPVNVEELADRIETENPLPLMRLWQESAS